jgi:hypothetical protein
MIRTIELYYLTAKIDPSNLSMVGDLSCSPMLDWAFKKLSKVGLGANNEVNIKI